MRFSQGGMGGSTKVNPVLSRAKLAKISIFFLHLIQFWCSYLTRPGFFSSGRGAGNVPEKEVLLHANFHTSAWFFPPLWQPAKGGWAKEALQTSSICNRPVSTESRATADERVLPCCVPFDIEKDIIFANRLYTAPLPRATCLKRLQMANKAERGTIRLGKERWKTDIQAMGTSAQSQGWRSSCPPFS